MTKNQINLRSVAAREKLPQRGEAYYQKIGPNLYVGYRVATKSSVWLARHVEPKPPYQRTKHTLQGIESLPPKDQFDRACEAARSWALTVTAGNVSGPVHHQATVSDVVKSYLSDMARRDPRAARRNGYAFKQLLAQYGDDKAATVTSKQLTELMDNMVTTNAKGSDPDSIRAARSTTNRALRVWKAAFNYGVLNDLVHVSGVKQWDRVKPYAKVEQARQHLLTNEEINTIFSASVIPEFADIVRYCKALYHTGCRPGEELSTQTVSGFNPVDGTIQVVKSKTGARTVVLSSLGVEFYKTMVEGKNPDDLIFKNGGNEWTSSAAGIIFDKLRKFFRLESSIKLYAWRHYVLSTAVAVRADLLFIVRNCGTSLDYLESNYGKHGKGYKREQMDALYGIGKDATKILPLIKPKWKD